MAKSANLGFPRLGKNREWKRACERYWRNVISADELDVIARELMQTHWRLQMEAEIDVIPVNDFSYYDHVLDMISLLGAVPLRYNADPAKPVDVDTYFAMARGKQDETTDVTAMEMTKWFDTNYHYIVPEFDKNTSFRLASDKPFQAVEYAQNIGIQNPRPVIIGPVSFLMLGKSVEDGVELNWLLEQALPVYLEILDRFRKMNVEWVQIDEPMLVLDLDEAGTGLFKKAYSSFSGVISRPKIMLTTYFGGLDENAELALSLKTEGIHLDLVRAPNQLDEALMRVKPGQIFSLGIVDGRNIWRTDIDKATYRIKRAVDVIGKDRIEIAPSCSLLHCPVDLDSEDEIEPDIKEWMAFGKQKLKEISTLTKAFSNNMDSVAEHYERSRKALSGRRTSRKVHNPDISQRCENVSEQMKHRNKPFRQRTKTQARRFKLPFLPTTTIGSFPQTGSTRKLRSDYKQGKLESAAYIKSLKEEIVRTLRFQEEAGLDVLVHGEFERADMVEYFGQKLNGFVFTKNGWVQSYGSRAVKPPIIYGDISRDKPMSVDWVRFAQNNTTKPVKGMLTGPVTMLQWSFVRDDQTPRRTCEQLALAIRDEVLDLEAAGIGVIQIDEPALREGLPLKQKNRDEYLRWAVACFRVSSSGVKAETQIHTHMCYSEFNDIMNSIADMDADVISIEASRSRMELLDSFKEFEYPNQIGPGVYDIHSPRIPSINEITGLIHQALKYVPADRLWINPDCGLKTRNWKEAKAALKNMVEAARQIRLELRD